MRCRCSQAPTLRTRPACALTLPFQRLSGAMQPHVESILGHPQGSSDRCDRLFPAVNGLQQLGVRWLQGGQEAFDAGARRSLGLVEGGGGASCPGR